MRTDDEFRARHGQRIAQGGVVLFLIGLVTGFFIYGIRIPAIALASHLIAIIGSTFMIALGAIWTRLKLTPRSSVIGLGLAFYAFYAGWGIYLLASIWGAGGMFPLAAGAAPGTAFQGTFIMSSSMTVAAAFVALSLLLLRGLRGTSSRRGTLDVYTGEDVRIKHESSEER